MSEELKPCEICGGSTVEIEPAGMIWKGTGGYSDPQYWRLLHWGQLETGEDADPFPTCKVEMRHRTEAQLVAAWNQRAKPVLKALVWRNSYGVMRADTAFGDYVVTGKILRQPGGAESVHENTQRAMAFGEEDFARRVHACLEGYDD